MTKLTTKNRDDAKALLTEHQLVSDALLNVGKPGFATDMFVNKEDDGDSTEVPLQYMIAKRALTEQKEWIEKELKKLDIEIG